MDRVSSVVVAMLVAVAVMPGASSKPQPARGACDGWEWVKVPRAGEIGRLSVIAVVSADDAWAVGSLGEDRVVASVWPIVRRCDWSCVGDPDRVVSIPNRAQ